MYLMKNAVPAFKDQFFPCLKMVLEGNLLYSLYRQCIKLKPYSN